MICKKVFTALITVATVLSALLALSGCSTTEEKPRTIVIQRPVSICADIQIRRAGASYERKALGGAAYNEGGNAHTLYKEMEPAPKTDKQKAKAENVATSATTAKADAQTAVAAKQTTETKTAKPAETKPAQTTAAKTKNTVKTKSTKIGRTGATRVISGKKNKNKNKGCPPCPTCNDESKPNNVATLPFGKDAPVVDAKTAPVPTNASVVPVTTVNLNAQPTNNSTTANPSAVAENSDPNQIIKNRMNEPNAPIVVNSAKDTPVKAVTEPLETKTDPSLLDRILDTLF